MARKLSRIAEARELIAEIHKIMATMDSAAQREINRTYDMTVPFITAFQFGWITGVSDSALGALREMLRAVQQINPLLHYKVKVGDVIEWKYENERRRESVTRIDDFNALTIHGWVNLFWYSKDVTVIR